MVCIASIAEPRPWIPAFAGMTELCKGLLGGKRGSTSPRPDTYPNLPNFVPNCSGVFYVAARGPCTGACVEVFMGR